MTQKNGLSSPSVDRNRQVLKWVIGLYFSIWFEVTAVNIKIIVLLDMTLCGLLQIMYYHVPENSNLYKLYIF
jgi:hypothetical protein